MSELLPEDIFEKALRRGSFTDDERVDLSNKFYAAMERRPSPKVDMGPCGLNEEDARKCLVHQCGDAFGPPCSCIKDNILALVRRLLSSTPPDPSSAARDAVIEAAKKLMDWNLLFLDQPRISVMTSNLKDLWCALARLAALGQEKAPAEPKEG